MKKILVTLLGAAFAIAIYWFGFAIGVYYTEHNTDMNVESIVLSDEELISCRIDEEWGPGYYGVIYGTNDDDYIDYEVYSEDGELQSICSTYRNYLQNTYQN